MLHVCTHYVYPHIIYTNNNNTAGSSRRKKRPAQRAHESEDVYAMALCDMPPFKLQRQFFTAAAMPGEGSSEGSPRSSCEGGLLDWNMLFGICVCASCCVQMYILLYMESYIYTTCSYMPYAYAAIHTSSYHHHHPHIPPQSHRCFCTP